MLSTLAYFELLTLTDGSYRRRCCVRRIILTRTLAFGRRRCRPLQQRCCRSNTRRFHRQDRRKSTLECRQEEKAFPKTPAKNEPKAEIGLVFISSCFSPRFLKPGSCKDRVLGQQFQPTQIHKYTITQSHRTGTIFMQLCRPWFFQIQPSLHNYTIAFKTNYLCRPSYTNIFFGLHKYLCSGGNFLLGTN